MEKILAKAPKLAKLIEEITESNPGSRSYGEKSGQSKIGKRPAGERKFKVASRQTWRKIATKLLAQKGMNFRRGIGDYSYAVPNRRDGEDEILPGMRIAIPVISVVLDVSGSMSTDTLKQALKEIEGLQKALAVPSLVVTGWNTEHQFTIKARRTDGIKIVSDGGTDMASAIGWVADGGHRRFIGKRQPDVLIVLTDGETPWPTKKPAMHVIVGLMVQDQDDARAVAGNIPDWVLETVIIPLRGSNDV